MPSSKGLPGDWDGLVVLHAANSYDSVKFADQHMAEALAKLVPVLYVDPPVSFLSPLRRPELRESLKRPRLRLLAPNLARLTPMAPPLMERPGVARVTTALVRRSMAATAEALTGGPGRVRATIATSALVPTLGACRERLRVYWAQDDFVGGAELFGSSAGRIQHGEIHLAAAADIIVASNPTVAATWRDRNRPTELIPFGCDAERFAGTDEAPRAEDVDLPGPIAGFVGHLGDRIQMDLLEAVAESGVSLLLVGPRHARFELARMQRLLARDNVQWVGDRRRPRPVHRFGLQPGQLPAEDAGVPGRRAGGGRDRPARHALAGHRPDPGRDDGDRVRQRGRRGAPGPAAPGRGGQAAGVRGGALVGPAGHARLRTSAHHSVALVAHTRFEVVVSQPLAVRPGTAGATTTPRRRQGA
jgi:teichuronic acid biosynthesis glycosyltransferase TuaH